MSKTFYLESDFLSYMIRAYDGLFKIEHDHDVWNLKNENRVEIVHQQRRGNIVTLEDTGSAWGKFSGGKILGRK